MKLHRLEPGVRKLRSDQVAVEEPLEIRVEFRAGGSWETRSVSVTMRTPGHDFELAAGFLFSESILSSREQVREISYCQTDAPQEYNVLSVHLRKNVPFDTALLTRNFYTSSSCGVCGKASIEAVEVRGCRLLPSDTLAMEAQLLASLPDLLLEGQAGFQRPGGLHAAGLFDSQGCLEVLREDVGRHNAVDKVVGHGFLEGTLAGHDKALVVSGRTSFEIIQKALMAGIPMVVAVGAPSSLAVELARKFNMTLIGFARGRGLNVYAGAERVLDWRVQGE
ncbi:MAG: formate dehydrogenase accessory sulfurtransferase FdhD [Longimicrobiales bacterium]|nr:formate dehydrogenase accessory sulfurtransferase FdhD [Longimicrobiales bacterium]